MAIRPPNFVAREMAYPRRDIWILLGASAIIRLLMLPLNEAEYTDGVLQVRQFVEPVGIWPPLYTAFVYPLHFVFGYLWSGRLVTAVASALAVWPIYRMTQRAFGTRAALYAGIFYLVAPVANRWAVRVMTEGTFVLFFWWACERLCYASDERDEEKARSAYGLAAMFTTLASLTRYQGLLLLGPLMALAFIIKRRFNRWPIKPTSWLLGLLVHPLWIYLAGFIHQEQFAARTVESQMPLWKVLALNGEAFIALHPYFLTYPVFIFALMGMFTTRMRRGPFFGWLMLYIGIVLLVAQSAFSSFQERYFLPLFGFFWCFAGSGLYAVQERWRRAGRPIRQRLFSYILIVTFVWSGTYSILVLLGHRETFGDIAKASRFASEYLAGEGEIYTNEAYRLENTPPIAATKVSQFSGMDANYLNETLIPPDIRRRPAQVIPPGSLVVLSDINVNAGYIIEYLPRHYRVVLLEEFEASTLPILPDVMSVNWPLGAQNPYAWMGRYDWQRFRTRVYLVEGLR